MRACVRAFKIGLVAAALSTASAVFGQASERAQFSDLRLYLVRVEEPLADSERRIQGAGSPPAEFDLTGTHFRVTVLDSCEPAETQILTIHRNQFPLVAAGTPSSVLKPIQIGRTYIAVGSLISHSNRTYTFTRGSVGIYSAADLSVDSPEIAGMLMFPTSVDSFPPVRSVRYLMPHQILYGTLASAIDPNDPESVVGGIYALNMIRNLKTELPDSDFYSYNPIGRILVSKAMQAEPPFRLLLLSLARHYFGQVDPELFLQTAEEVALGDPLAAEWAVLHAPLYLTLVLRPPNVEPHFRLDQEQRERVQRLLAESGDLSQYFRLMFGSVQSRNRTTENEQAD